MVRKRSWPAVSHYKADRCQWVTGSGFGVVQLMVKDSGPPICKTPNTTLAPSLSLIRGNAMCGGEKRHRGVLKSAIAVMMPR